MVFLACTEYIGLRSFFCQFDFGQSVGRYRGTTGDDVPLHYEKTPDCQPEKA